MIAFVFAPVYRGALQRKLGDFNSAIDDYLLALDKTDHDEESPVYQESQRQLLLSYNDFAIECFTKGFYDEAIILLNKAIKGEKEEKGLYINRGGKRVFRCWLLQFVVVCHLVVSWWHSGLRCWSMNSRNMVQIPPRAFKRFKINISATSLCVKIICE